MVTHNFTSCPRCGAPTERSITWSGAPSEFWYSCTHCNTHINTYRPQPHQMEFHLDSYRYLGNFGSYGTGKTLTSREEFYKHLFLTPNGITLIGANIAPQYEQTIKRDIELDLPKAFITNYSAQKQYYDFINGHRLMFRPFDDPNKLRSLNLSMFIILEGSEVTPEAFVQLKSRTRNAAAQKYHPTAIDPATQKPLLLADWRKGIVESNPDAGWIRTEVLLRSAHITKHPFIKEKFLISKRNVDPFISSHVTPTMANRYLPPNFYEENAAQKPLWWVRRYLDASFSYAEGLVYPSAMRYVVPTFEVPRHWKRLIAFDYGLQDAAVFVFAAVDPATGITYFYNEMRAYEHDVEQLAALYFKGIEGIPSGGLYSQPLIDPRSGPRRDYHKKSLADYFMDYGIYFKPGVVSIDTRVYKVNTYLEAERIRYMDCCQYLIEELQNYKFEEQKVGQPASGKPMDKNNHSINAHEWIICELPKDPKQLENGGYDRQGRPLRDASEHNPSVIVPWQMDLAPDEDPDSPFGVDFTTYNF